MDEGSAGKPAILVSACLLGVRCNHVGSTNTSDAVIALGERAHLVPVCPEVAGGLSTPRPAAEVQPDGRVVNEAGDDVTAAYERGAAHALRVAQTTGATEAVLKARSPSCGCHQIYDGTFSGTRVGGEGVAAEALRAAGLEVLNEDEVDRVSE